MGSDKDNTEENERIVIYYQGKYLNLKAKSWKKVAKPLKGFNTSPAQEVIDANKKVAFIPVEEGQAPGIGGYSVVLNLDALLPRPRKPKAAAKRGKKVGKTPKKPK
jgi:hypothetical protein